MLVSNINPGQRVNECALGIKNCKGNLRILILWKLSLKPKMDRYTGNPRVMTCYELKIYVVYVVYVYVVKWNMC